MGHFELIQCFILKFEKLLGSDAPNSYNVAPPLIPTIST